MFVSETSSKDWCLGKFDKSTAKMYHLNQGVLNWGRETQMQSSFQLALYMQFKFMVKNNTYDQVKTFKLAVNLTEK